MNFLDMMNDPNQMGLMAAAARMLEMSGPSRTPVGIGQIMGGGFGAYANTAQAMKQRQAEEEERRQMMQMRGLQMHDIQGQMDARNQKMITPKEKKVKDWNSVNVNGKIMYAPFFEDGTHGEPVPMEMAYKLDAKDTGQTTDLINPYSGKVVSSLKNTVSPNTAFTGQVSMRGQNMTDQRAREFNAITSQGQQTQIINDPTMGPLLINKATGQAQRAMMGGAPVQGESAMKKEAAARGLVPVLDQAEKLIDGATGSYIGAGADQLARAFGASTTGANNIAQLKVLEGQIMMNQPRMEGPQSNLDVELYRQMAAKIGDRTIPNAQKKAAFKTLREINSRYTGNGGASADWSIQRVN